MPGRNSSGTEPEFPKNSARVTVEHFSSRAGATPACPLSPPTKRFAETVGWNPFIESYVASAGDRANDFISMSRAAMSSGLRYFYESAPAEVPLQFLDSPRAGRSSHTTSNLRYQPYVWAGDISDFRHTLSCPRRSDDIRPVEPTTSTARRSWL